MFQCSLALSKHVNKCKTLISRCELHTRADIVISGGGMVGAACAAALSQLEVMRDRRVVLLESSPKREILPPESGFSNRVAAIRPGSVALLERLGAWQIIEQTRRAQPVKRMQVWESATDASISFSSHHGEPLSYIVENDVTQMALNSLLETFPNLQVEYGRKMTSCRLQEDLPTEHVSLTLDNGDTVSAALLVGADGFNSVVRKTLGCDTMSWEYNQMGVVATLKLETSSVNDTAFQRFLSTGPIGILPLDNSTSSLVWTLPTQEAREMVKLPEAEFVSRLTDKLWSRTEVNSLANSAAAAFDSLRRGLGAAPTAAQLPPKIIGASGRAMFPLGFNHSTRYIGPRTVLVGDAAHRVHPLAGQGVNLGFGDVSTLANVVTDSLRDGAGLGNYSYLCRYETERQRENVPVMFAIDGLQKLYSSSLFPVVLARSLGLQLSDSLTPLKRAFIQRASG